jgi:hypothetical protein
MNVIRRNILEGYYTEDDIVSKSIEVDCIAKGSKANIGEIREWSGKKYQKQANGQWKEVVEGSKEGIAKKKKVDIETYHDSFTSASTNAREYAESKGYQIDEDDWQTQVALGGKYGRSRPSEGNSHSFTVGLIKDGKPQRKALSFTVYGMSSGKYELVAYVN